MHLIRVSGWRVGFTVAVSAPLVVGVASGLAFAPRVPPAGASGATRVAGWRLAGGHVGASAADAGCLTAYDPARPFAAASRPLAGLVHIGTVRSEAS